MEGRTPIKLNGNQSENWKVWLQKFEIFSTATGLDNKPQKIQCAQSIHLNSRIKKRTRGEIQCIFHAEEKYNLRALQIFYETTKWRTSGTVCYHAEKSS